MSSPTFVRHGGASAHASQGNDSGAEWQGGPSKDAGAAAVRVTCVIDTPLGPMRLDAHGGALTGAWFVDQVDVPTIEGPHVAPDHPVLEQAARQLAQWFAGDRREFTLALAPAGSHFQRRVWDRLRDLPFGALQSYGDLARRVAGDEEPVASPRRAASVDAGLAGVGGGRGLAPPHYAAVRAVAQAVGRNPISIIIPCHRIVGSDTSLTGFGGGLARKQWLLGLEGHVYAHAAPGARRIERDANQGSLPF
jgi:methylated-DNA-[protein]-cysteine S-methyltransferase